MHKTISTFIPVLTHSLNRKVHWSIKAKEAKRARMITQNFVSSELRRASYVPGEEIVVTLSRVGSRKMDDDNLAGALKPVRDGVADALGMDDGDDRLMWRYNQILGRRGQFGVFVNLFGVETRN